MRTALEELQNVPLDEFFDSNDGFEDLILAAEANIPNSANSIVSRTETVLPDDLAAAFNDDDDDLLANMQWGSTTRQSSNFSTDIRPASNQATTEFDDSLSAVFQDENDFSDDYVWGSAAKNARVSEPATKKPRMHTQDAGGTQDNYSWGSSDQVTHIQDEVSVKCSGCHQTAKEYVYTFEQSKIQAKTFKIFLFSDWPLKRKDLIKVVFFIAAQKVIHASSFNGLTK